MMVFAASRVVPVPPARAWERVADLEGYAEVTPTLSRIELGGPPAVGSSRRCYNAKGQGWDESCTLWEEGRAYGFEVDTSTYPLSLRAFLRAFRGTWRVEPHPSGAEISMRFEAEPRFGPIGGLALRASARGAGRLMETILDNWERQLTVSPQPQAGD